MDLNMEDAQTVAPRPPWDHYPQDTAASAVVLFVGADIVIPGMDSRCFICHLAKTDWCCSGSLAALCST